MRPVITLALSAFAGLLLASGYPPYSFSWWAFFSFVPFLFALGRCRSGVESLIAGGVAGLVAVAGVHGWLVSFRQWAGDWSILFFFLVLVNHATFFVLFALVFHRLRRRFSVAAALILSPLSWTFAEWISTFGTLGLQQPLGHSQFSNEFIRGASSLLGVDYVTYLAVSVSAVIVLWISLPRAAWVRTAGITAFLAALFVLNTVLIQGQNDERKRERAVPLDVALVQPSFDPSWINEEKMSEKIFEVFLNETARLASKRPHLLIWPENAFPEALNDAGRNRYQFFGALNDFDGEVLVGGSFSEGRATFNSAALFAGKSMSIVYEKERLFPYGEAFPRYSPFRVFRRFMPAKLRGDGITAGRFTGPVATKFSRIGISICLESLYGDPIRRKVREGAEFLLNLTNDTWFQKSSASEKHFYVGAMRAIENGRYFIQSALYGVTGVVDPEGNVVARTGPEGNRSLEVTVYPYQSKTWFTRVGLWRFPIFLLLSGINLFIYYFKF